MNPVIFKYCDGKRNKIRWLKITVFDKKTELGAEERIPIFFFKSPPLRVVISSDKTKISSTSKTCDMSDDPQLSLLVSVSPSSAKLQNLCFWISGQSK
jgi:hypothetical protein